MSISCADDSYEAPFFPFRSYSLKSILRKKEILQEDFDKFRRIVTEILRADSDGKKIDFNLINSVCLENNLTFKRFFYTLCKQPVCLREPYSDSGYKNLVLSCTKNEILLSHANKDALLIKNSIVTRLHPVK
jgi:hypothetical protein